LLRGLVRSERFSSGSSDFILAGMAVGFPRSRFVGRAEELGQLLAALRRSEQGKLASVLLAGDAGVGKTYLLAQLVGHARQRGVQALVGGCLEVGDVGLPYVPIVAALRGFAADPDSEERLAAAAKGLPCLAHLLSDLAVQPSAGTALGGGLEQLQLFDSVRALLVRLSEGAPVLVVLEDLHWADRSTRDLLAFLVRTLHGSVALVASYRSDALDRRHPLSPLLVELVRQPGMEHLELAPFGRADLAEQLAVVAGRRLPGAAVERIFVRSEGNPFYAEELLAAGADQADVRLPASLAAVLLARVEVLSEPAQQLLRVMAVAGRRVGHALLVAATGRSELELEGSLREAVSARLLVADAPSDTYAFRHALLREAVYGDLLPGERIRLHATYAHLLAGSGPAAELAHHCLACQDLPGALAALVRAAADASAMSAPAAAFRHLSQALGLWRRVPDAEVIAGVDRVDLLLRAAEAASQSGELRRAVSLAREAVDAIDTDTEPLRAAFACERFGQYLLDTFAIETASEETVEACHRAVELVPAEPATPLRARVVVGLADALLGARRPDEARRWCGEALAVARAARSDDDEARALISLAILERDHDDPDTARTLLGDARTRAATAGNRSLELRALQYLGDQEFEAGNLPEACTAFDTATHLAEQSGLAWSAYGLEIRILCCIAYYQAGDWNQAERLGVTEDDRRLAAGGPSAAALYVDVARGRVVPADRLDWLATLGEADPWTAYLTGGCTADLACWQGDLDKARALVQSTLSGVDRLGKLRALSAIWPASIGLGAEANRAKRAQVAGDEPGVGEARALGRELVDRARAAVRRARESGRQVGPEALAWLARCEAEWTRLEGHSDPEAWRAAVDAFSYGYVYEEARSRWRLAEALLGTGDREQAAAEALAAHHTAVRLWAEPLRGAVEALARRARLGLGQGLPHESGRAGLTPRELEVLGLLVAGKSNRQIAEDLFISGKTAGVHVTNILAKLGVHSRLQAAARARELGL
jgi:DNA-binding NarL/FixJ family response regulator